MAQKNNINLTEGDIRKQILRFIIPVIISSVFQQFYSLTNQLIVGNYVSKEALSAVSACNVITSMFMFFFGGIALGAGIVTSHAYGSKNHEKLRDTVSTAIIIAFFGGIILTVLSELTVKWMMNLVNINETLYPIALGYLRVYLIGNIAVFMYNMGFHILRSIGDSRHPLYYLIISSIVNVVLGVIFVRKLNMMATGTALATIISQFIVDILCYSLIARNEVLGVDMKHLRIDWDIVGEIFRLGVPAGIQNSLIGLAGATVQAYTNLFSNEFIAGVGVAQRVTSYVQSSMNALTTVSTSFVGQNYGAGKYERVREGTKFCLRLSNTVSLTLATLVFIFAKPLVSMFNKNPQIVGYGVEMVRWTVYSTVFLGWSHIYNGVCRGAGNVKFPLIIAVTTQVVVRYIFVVVAFKISFSVYHIYVANMIGFVLAGIAATLYFRYGKWTKEHYLRT